VGSAVKECRTVFIASKLSKPLLRQSDSACSAIFVSPSLAYAHAMLYSCDVPGEPR
jgi:hypothetical protein